MSLSSALGVLFIINHDQEMLSKLNAHISVEDIYNKSLSSIYWFPHPKLPPTLSFRPFGHPPSRLSLLLETQFEPWLTLSLDINGWLSELLLLKSWYTVRDFKQCPATLLVGWTRRMDAINKNESAGLSHAELRSLVDRSPCNYTRTVVLASLFGLDDKMTVKEEDRSMASSSAS